MLQGDHHLALGIDGTLPVGGVSYDGHPLDEHLSVVIGRGDDLLSLFVDKADLVIQPHLRHPLMEALRNGMLLHALRKDLCSDRVVFGGNDHISLQVDHAKSLAL